MTRHHEHDDDDLRALLADAVDDLEPTDRLAAIRAGAAEPQRPDSPESPGSPDSPPLGTKVTPMSNRRPWLYAVTGAAVATAAVLAVITLASGSILGGDDPEPAAASDSASAEPSDEPSEEPSDGGSPEPRETESPRSGEPDPEPPVAGETTVPVYYTGDGPDGPVLYREFHRAPVRDGSDVRLTAAAREAVSGTPLDPDYRSDWPGVEVQQVNQMDDVIAVDLDTAPSRPGGMSAREAQLAVQQVVYTVQGAAQARPGVRFTVGGRPVDQVLGVSTAEPVTNAPMLRTLSRMIITSPFEGQEVSDTFEATGANNSFEATVAWQVRDNGGEVVAEGAGIADGYLAEKLFPWSVKVDVSGLDPGTYTFVAMNDDPEGTGAATDTRTIVVR